MSNLSNNQGRAFEYICLITLNEEINKIRPAKIIQNSSYRVDYLAWQTLDNNLQNTLHRSALATINTIFDLEPMIIENSGDTLQLSLQTDSKGKEGDVRDIIIERKDVQWQIGLSIKHNHFAVKHSRLAKNLDFGQKWYGIPCSQQYWNEVKPIFDYLEVQRLNNIKWNELPNKFEGVYIPILLAFKNEVKRSLELNPLLPSLMTKYLIGEFDFYKLISIDTKRLSQIQAFNMYGQLNKKSNEQTPKIIVPLVALPTRIIHLDLIPNRENALELYMDGGWQFTLRIHNASTIVEPSLKFDIQIVGVPATVLSINCLWK